MDVLALAPLERPRRAPGGHAGGGGGRSVCVLDKKYMNRGAWISLVFDHSGGEECWYALRNVTCTCARLVQTCAPRRTPMGECRHVGPISSGWRRAHAHRSCRWAHALCMSVCRCVNTDCGRKREEKVHQAHGSWRRCISARRLPRPDMFACQFTAGACVPVQC